MMHKKTRDLLLNLLMICISGRLTHQILSLIDDYTFRFSNFPMICLSNSSANCWFGIMLLVTPLPGVFLSKNL